MNDDRFAEGLILGQNNGYGNGYGFGGGWEGLIGLVLVAGLLGNGNFGGLFGGGNNRANCATTEDVRAAVDQQTLISKIDQQTYGIADSFNSLNNTLNNNFRGIDNAICSLGYNQALLVNGLSRELAQCCCDTRSAIADVKYANERNTCDIIRAGQDNTRAILDYLTTEKISSLQSENAGLKAQISNDRQSRYIVDALSPKCPQPAYVVQPPQEVTFPTNCCGNVAYANYNSNSCGCGL